MPAGYPFIPIFVVLCSRNVPAPIFRGGSLHVFHAAFRAADHEDRHKHHDGGFPESDLPIPDPEEGSGADEGDQGGEPDDHAGQTLIRAVCFKRLVTPGMVVGVYL